MNEQANIRVICRFRPQNKREIDENSGSCVKFDENKSSVTTSSADGAGVFHFDRIFDETSTQMDIFEDSAHGIVGGLLSGFNGTILAYGQTGTGKTHTMMGDMENEESKGLSPRIVQELFTTIMNSPSNLEFNIKCSFMEIYMERVRDLLVPSNDNLPVKEDKFKGVYVKDLTEINVGSVHDVFNAMRRGQSSRAVTYTDMNSESSRSHSIFSIHITQKDLINGSSKTGKLSLVDLAGSERVGKSGATGQTLEETKKINKSLSSLGMVINALTDGKSQHIPYRDSKLTRILQESIGGNSRTTLIINCSPSIFNESETISTLRFGTRAKYIKNKLKVNAELSPKELEQLLKKAKLQVSEIQGVVRGLESELGQWRSGKNVPESEWIQLGTMSTRKTFASIDSLPLSPNVSDPFLADERDEFIRRENELSDLLAGRQQEVKSAKAYADSISEQMEVLRQRHTDNTLEHLEMSASINEYKLKLEKSVFQNKESSITIDELRESNTAIEKDLQMKMIQMDELAVAKSLDEYMYRKQERMQQMLTEFYPSGPMKDKEIEMRTSFDDLSNLSITHAPTDSGNIEQQQFAFVKAESEIKEMRSTITDLESRLETKDQTIQELEGTKTQGDDQLLTLKNEYTQLLEKALADEMDAVGDASSIQHLKDKLEAQYATKIQVQEQEVQHMTSALKSKKNTIETLQSQIISLTEENKKLATADTPIQSPDRANLEEFLQTLGEKLVDFDVLKKKMMHDLEKRCERVVELELSLDGTREQYNAILRNSNSSAQQQKMLFLERNLSQLALVQKRIVDQNANLKKSNSIQERKLTMKNEQIARLESLLLEFQTKCETQSRKLEAQLASANEKMASKEQWGTWMQSSKIAKPLRGGIAASGDDDDTMSVRSPRESLLGSDAKRSSWYVSLLKK